MYFDDGASPPEEILQLWNDLITRTFDARNTAEEKPCIAVHCVAGLGR